MNLINKIHVTDNLTMKKENRNVIISNKGKNYGKVIIFKIFKGKKEENFNIKFYGKVFSGDSPELKIINRKGEVIYNIDFQSSISRNIPARMFMIAIKVTPYSEFELSTLDIDFNIDIQNDITKDFNGEILLVAPGYPSNSNKYLFGFVHTRVLEYISHGYNIDVAYLNDSPEYRTYNFEGVKVNKISYFDMRNLLQIKKYKKIIVHFFTEQIAQILDATNIIDTDIYIFTHGSDILYRDINVLTSPYFKPIADNSLQQEHFFDVKDKIINRYNNMTNVKFIFASEWAKSRSEQQNQIKYHNCEVLPTYIDENVFKYNEKNVELRKKIVIIRKFDNLSTYSIDVNVRAILELSKRNFFNDLEFDIYGDGDFHDELLKPLEQFSNVHIYKKFLTHQEISNIHSKHGIALFATRYETQGVSAAEAAMAGVVVISSFVAAVPEMFGKIETLTDVGDYVAMADIVENLYNNPKKFLELSAKMHKLICSKYSFNNTIKEELMMLDKKLPRKNYKFNKLATEKILTVAVASYNVDKFLRNSIESLISSSIAEKLEILIINDGSKDNTSKIAQELQDLTTIGDDSIVKLVDKKNGGHGSTINKGIEMATGRYFKLMDGDDYFNTEHLEKLVNYLETEDTDIVLNNYVEDLSVPCKFNVVKHYEFMEPGKQYKIEDLCYEGYGFDNWGPLLSTSTYKTSMLKKANFKISEHCFYVDMELNSIAFACAETVKYYPLDIYIYYLGRVGQSVSAASFKKNYKHHEKVTLRIIEDIYLKFNLSETKKNYLKNKIIIPLIKTQYLITIDYFDNGKPFVEFDSKLSAYPEFYNLPTIINRRIKVYRLTNGKFVKLIKTISNIKNVILKK